MKEKRIGFTCAYAPVPIIEAAGFFPYRIFPDGDSPDQAGHLLHDNLCPHVKRVLDRALADDLPQLDGMVFINSCDSMRRLADAWTEARPGDRTLLLDLPSVNSRSSVTFLAKEYKRMARTLFQWNDTPFSDETVNEKVTAWNQLAAYLETIETRMGQAFYPGLAADFQRIINAAASHGLDQALHMAETTALSEPSLPQKGAVPVFVFGNLLFDPTVFDLFEEWNMHVTASDFCTGSRFVNPVKPDVSGDIFMSLATSFLDRPPCARTMDSTMPGQYCPRIVKRARQSNARGAMGFTLKFCDPYLARIPGIREALQKESIPFLMLEGDCTMGSIGQQQTRIEAFTEMLGV